MITDKAVSKKMVGSRLAAFFARHFSQRDGDRLRGIRALDVLPGIVKISAESTLEHGRHVHALPWRQIDRSKVA